MPEMLLLYSYDDLDCIIVCPAPDAKAKKSDTYVESKGVLALRYDILMHFAIAYMRRLDGAEPPLACGRKSLDLLAPPGTSR